MFCCLIVGRPIWDRSITPNVIMINAIIESFPPGVDSEIFAHELVLKEETSVAEIARYNLWMWDNVGDVLNFAAFGPVGFESRYVTRPNLEQKWAVGNLRKLFIEWNLTTSFIFLAIMWPKLSQFWVGHVPNIVWHFMWIDPSTVSLPLSEFSYTHLANRVVVKYGWDFGELLLNCLLGAYVLKKRNSAPKVVGKEVEAVSGSKTHVCQVVDRLHAISSELHSEWRW